ncbi:MAG: phenylacetate-CoA oxygenase subunit PaaI [Gemmatimonadota bacterium]|nr:phenylacetate-CoA oxygenase subunit PaaI [Gemmatimonadota bacterium]MDE2870380.1 phenylacetate-CoA oxygenase subunit PaaI [Gemmatimonadota bacterium]
MTGAAGTREDAYPAGRETAPAPLSRHILTLADTKRLLGIRYSDWILGSPSIETGIAASSMAQDEWGHARLLYAMLKKQGFDPFEVEHTRPAGRYYSVPALDRPFADWADFTAAVVVVDGALAVALESFAAGSFALAASRIPKMLAEEEYHRRFGFAWFARLAAAGGEAEARLREAALAMLPSTLAWLLPEDDVHEELVAEGRVWPGGRVRERCEERLAGVLGQAGFSLADVEPARGGWDPERRRGPGAPGEEAVERARGDRNRALFVE